MNNRISLKNKSLRKGLFILSLCLIFAAALRYSYFRKESPAFFSPDKKEGKVSLNTALLKEMYKDLSSVPYNYSTRFTSEKLPGVIRIFLIGESSLSGWPYSAEQSVEKKVRFDLSKYAPAVKFELITVSFAGFNSSFASEILPQVFKYDPDLIIVYSGHNEFYGYKSSAAGTNLLKNIGHIPGSSSGLIKYESSKDDLELLLPLLSESKLIQNEKHEYKAALERFRENIKNIISLCRENKVPLVLSDLADNLLLPPLGISSGSSEQSGQLSADLIFNNARMALLRDGNDTAAVKLFYQSKEMDALRLRVPEMFSGIMRKLTQTSKDAELAGLKEEFTLLSQNHIPGNDLFADYIHPNLSGLDIVAAVYTKIILNRFYKQVPAPSVKELIENRKLMKQPTDQAELELGRQRAERAASRRHSGES